MGWYSYDNFPRRATAAERKQTVASELAKMKKAGRTPQPIVIEGLKIAKTFWGKAWCSHIECLSDFASRLDRGKTYARNGSVFHLEITPGKVSARVAGSEVYDITVEIQPLGAERWTAIKQACAGQITSAVELLSGRLSDATMAILTDADTGMFPHADDFDLDCSCPDFARLCKHLAAVLYGVGARLDAAPEWLFTLRGVDPTELLTSAAQNYAASTAEAKSTAPTVEQDALADVFGIDLDLTSPVEIDEPKAGVPKPPRKPARKSPKRTKRK